MARALVKPVQGRVPVSLLNPRTEMVSLKAGAVEDPATETEASVATDKKQYHPRRRENAVAASGEELTLGEKEKLFALLLSSSHQLCS